MSVIFGLADRIRVDCATHAENTLVFNNVTLKKNTWFSTPSVSFDVHINADWVIKFNTGLLTSTPLQSSSTSVTDGGYPMPITFLSFKTNEKAGQGTSQPLQFSCAINGAEHTYIFMLNGVFLFESKYSLPIPIKHSGMSVTVSEWKYYT